MVSVWILAGCLDAGAPPLGRHLAAGRDEDRVELVAGATGAAKRIVLSHLQMKIPELTTARLSSIDDPGPGGGATTPRLLLDDTEDSLPSLASLTLCPSSGCKRPVDAGGRLYLARALVTENPDSGLRVSTELVRVDPASGDQRSFGSIYAFDISSSGTRIAFQSMVTGTTSVVDVGDSQTSLSTGGGSPAFVGDDLFFIAGDGQLMHLPLGDPAPTPLDAAVQRFDTFETERGALLVLHRVMSPERPEAAASLLDPVTLAETALPSVTAAAQMFLPSPDGRYLASEGFGSSSVKATPYLTIFDRDTARETLHDIPSNQSFQVPVWRPGHDEVWFIASDIASETAIPSERAWRWLPDSEAIPVGSGALSPSFWSGFVADSPQELPVSSSPVFTPDGRFRLLTANTIGKTSVDLESADDDTAPPLLLNPDGTGLAGLWPLVDGRLLVEAWINDGRRNDVYLVDPEARSRRSLASTGHVLATGRDRFLALQHVVLTDGSGDLTSIDYATGTETLIAENVHSVAVDVSPVSDDALAPGTRVVYLVRNRIASPYDGCWAIDLP